MFTFDDLEEQTKQKVGESKAFFTQMRAHFREIELAHLQMEKCFDRCERGNLSEVESAKHLDECIRNSNIILVNVNMMISAMSVFATREDNLRKSFESIRQSKTK